MGLTAKRLMQGFTLVELVIVIIVLGVLSSVAIPKFVGRASFEDYTVRDQLIARLRLVQLQNMNTDPNDNVSENACYWLVISSNNCFYNDHTVRDGENCSLPSDRNICDDDSFSEHGVVSFPPDMLEGGSYLFDIEGKLISGRAPITVTGDNGLQVTIEAEGFIHEGE